MAVIELCSNVAVTLDSGSIGFGYNPELSIKFDTQLFDGTVSADDVVIYRKNPSTIIYKGIIRKIRRDLSGEALGASVSAAETVLEGLRWTPTLLAYNKEILCKEKLMNATIADIVAHEFTGHVPPGVEQGPKDWFTSVEVPASVASLIAAPVETAQTSFIGILEAALAIYEHVKWFIEYDAASTDILPLGKLVLVDTNVGRTPRVLTLGGATPDLISMSLIEDYSTCATALRVFGGGDFVEKDEILEPAWDTADETLEKTLVIPAPTEEDVAEGGIPVSYIPWGYELAGVVSAYITLVGNPVPVRIFWNADFWLNTETGALLWNTYNGVVREDGAPPMQTLLGSVPPGHRRVAYHLPGFFGATVEITIQYCGPDCYRLYKVSEPIANLRYRLAKVVDPENPGDVIDQPVEQSTHIEAFTQVISTDDSLYEVDPRFAVAKVRIAPDTNEIFWDERNPQVASSKGFGVPIGSPEYEPGRDCVRFTERQLMSVVPFWTEITPEGQSENQIRWLTWPVICRYTAWRNLEQTRTGDKGSAYTGRFVFDDLRKYTQFDGSLIVDKTTELSAAADSVKGHYGETQWSGTATVSVVMGTSGPYKLATLSIGIGDSLTVTGNVDSAISTAFFGIVNSIDLTSLETGQAAIGFGPKEPNRNPFAPKPPVYVDRQGPARIVYDRSIFDRRST